MVVFQFFWLASWICEYGVAGLPIYHLLFIYFSVSTLSLVSHWNGIKMRIANLGAELVGESTTLHCTGVNLIYVSLSLLLGGFGVGLLAGY